MRYEYRISSVNKTLEAALRSVDRLLRDKVSQGVDVTVERLARFRDSGSRLYCEAVIEDWMIEYGLAARGVNRAGHKRFLPNGQWISNGVTFGEARL